MYLKRPRRPSGRAPLATGITGPPLGARSMLGVIMLIFCFVGCSQGEPATTAERAGIADTTPIVDSRSGPCVHFDEWTDGIAAIIWLDLAPTPDQIAAIEAALVANDDLEYLFVDQATGFKEFQAMFADSEQILSSVSLEDVKASFRLRTSDGGLLYGDSPLIKELRADPVVADIHLASDSLSGPFADC